MPTVQLNRFQRHETKHFSRTLPDVKSQEKNKDRQYVYTYLLNPYLLHGSGVPWGRVWGFNPPPCPHPPPWRGGGGWIAPNPPLGTPLYSCQMITKPQFSREISIVIQMSYFSKKPCGGNRAVPRGRTDGLTDGHDEYNCRISQFMPSRLKTPRRRMSQLLLVLRRKQFILMVDVQLCLQ
jgi:hypothetical protein